MSLDETSIEPQVLPIGRSTVELVDAMASIGFDALVRSITSSVVAKLGETNVWDVERIVVEELTQMQDARITKFVPILVERAALDRIRRARDGGL